MNKLNLLRSARQRGFSLLEVIVAIFVMSIGMLGMAGLTASASANNKLAQMKSTSLMLVNDYADRARANLTGFDAGNYEKKDTYSYSTTLESISKTCSTFDANAPCTAAEIAKLDQDQWINTVRKRLPGGAVYATTTNTAGTDTGRALRSMDIWLMWTEAEQSSSLGSFGGNTIFPCPSAASAPSEVRCMYFRIAI